MTTRKISTLAVLAACAALLAPAAVAGDILCPPDIAGGTIAGGLVVPQNGLCFISGATIQGGIKVEKGGELVAFLAKVEGNIQADEAKSILLFASDISGNVQVVKTTGIVAEDLGVSVIASKVGGDLQLNLNRTSIVFTENSVHGNVQVTDNTSAFIIVGVNELGLTIGGNLECFNNTGSVTAQGNVVGGTAQGQCAPSNQVSASRLGFDVGGRVVNPRAFDASRFRAVEVQKELRHPRLLLEAGEILRGER